MNTFGQTIYDACYFENVAQFSLTQIFRFMFHDGDIIRQKLYTLISSNKII